MFTFISWTTNFKFRRNSGIKLLQWYDKFLTKTYWTIENYWLSFTNLNVNNSTMKCFVFLIKRFGVVPFLIYLKFRYALLKFHLKVNILLLKVIYRCFKFVGISGIDDIIGERYCIFYIHI